jgi:hypothetical protein
MTDHGLRIYDGQSYHLVRSEPYTRLDGGKTTLLVWQSGCSVCGVPFEFRTPAKAGKFLPNRRCSKHKSPGCRVNPRRERRPDEVWPDIHDHTAQLEDAEIQPEF